MNQCFEKKLNNMLYYADDNTLRTQDKRTRQMKFGNFYTKKRMVYFIISSLVTLIALTSVKLFISYYSTEKSAEITLANQYIEIAEDVAEGLDKDVYQKFLLTKQYDQNREKTKLYLEQYRNRIHALYVYILMLDESDISKVMVSGIPPDTEDLPIGEPCTVPPSEVRKAKSGQSYFTDIIKEGEHGAYLSIGVPFYGDDGKILGVIGIDIDAVELEHVSDQVIKSNIFIFVIDVLFAIALLIVVFVLNKWYKLRLKRDLKESEKMFISELGKVMDTIKSSRHDMMNHLHILNGLMDMRLYDKAGDYLKQLSFESKTLDLSLRLKSPVLIVLFQSKWELAQSKNIVIHFETDQNEYSRVESMDLVKIYSNLLDNAIEAVESYSGELPKQIRVICKAIGEKYVFAVENPAQLSDKEEKSLFEYGYTTKESDNAFRGNGLTIIKKKVEEYKGDIYFQYEKSKVFIQITL